MRPKIVPSRNMDGDSLDESLATCMTSSKVILQLYLGLHFEAELWADYKLADNMCVGDALWQKKYEMKVEQDKATWTINFNVMTQVTDRTGTSNNIRRTMVASKRVTMEEFVALASYKSISTLKAQTMGRGTLQEQWHI